MAESTVHAATPGPTITILSPADGKTVWVDKTISPVYPIRIVFSAWDGDGTGTIANYSFSSNGGGSWIGIAPSVYGAPDNKIYRYYDWTPPAAGPYDLRVRATDGTNTGTSRKVRINVRVGLTNYSTFPGDGKLLVRDNDNTICMACHALKTHSSADIGSTKYGNWERICRDCHTPHNTRNIFLLQSSFRTFTSMNQTYSGNRKVDFRNISGESAYGFVTKSGSPRRGPCEVCHTRTGNSDGTPRWRNYTSTPDTEGAFFIQGYKHNSDRQCISCHKHTEGFAGKESTGSQDCDGCHKGLFNVMNKGNNLYHHYLDNPNVTVQPDSGSKYTVTTSIIGTKGGNAKRRCLMCHADHDVFSPANNPTYSKGRAGNLRKSIMIFPTRTSNFVRTEFVNETSTSKKIWGGLCMSCHRKSQRKFTSMLADDGSVATPIIPFPGGAPSDYAATAHGSYTIPATFRTDRSVFNANCLKCHNDALRKTKQAGSGRNEFGTHSSSFSIHGSTVRRMQALMGAETYLGVASGFDTVTTLRVSGNPWTTNQWQDRTVAITFGPGKRQGRNILSNTSNRLRVDLPWDAGNYPASGSKFNIGDPIEEDLCYSCHSSTDTTINPNGPSGKDYYGIKSYDNEKAQKMYEQFNPGGWPASGVGTVGSASSTSITATPSPGWTTDQWKGYMVLIKSGYAKGMTALINTNTATTLSVNRMRRTPRSGDKFVIQGNPYRHNIEMYTGKHRTDEYFLAENGPTNTPVGWFNAVGGEHNGCTDCHNPHSAKKQGLTSGRATNDTFTTASTITDDGSMNGTKSWAPDQWRGYVVRIYDSGFNNLYTSILGQQRMIVSNTANKLVLGGTFLAANGSSPRPAKGSYYAVVSTGRPPESLTGSNDAGNDINNANYGVWGVNVSYTNVTASPTSAKSMKKNPWFTKTGAVTKVYEICFKCHSDYGWGNNGPRIEIPDAPGATVGTFTNGTSSNVAREFNPNNLSHHAIYAPGNNQPIKANYGNTGVISSYNTGIWPYYATTGSSDTLVIDSSGNAMLSGAANLPSTVIAGWYVWIGTGVNSDMPNNNSDTPRAGTSNTGWFQIGKITDSKHFKVSTAGVTVPVAATQYWAITAGLGNNFVPPYGPWSVISCADCHGADRKDPAGPHASSLQWLRREIDRSISFDWFNGTKVVRVTYDSTLNSGANTRYMCLNCHRTDVYGYDKCMGCTGGVTVSGGGTPAGAAYARVNHPTDGRGGQEADGSLNTFGIACMHCHGGSFGTYGSKDSVGSIHGSNLGKNPSKYGGSGQSYSGRRLLNGAVWFAVTRATKTTGVRCWTKNGTDRVQRCGQDHTGDEGNTANYDYESGAD